MHTVFVRLFLLSALVLSLAGCATSGEHAVGETPLAHAAPADNGPPQETWTGGLVLLPQPREVAVTSKVFRVSTSQVYVTNGMDVAFVERLVPHVNDVLDTIGLGEPGPRECAVEVNIDRVKAPRPEGYLIEVTPDAVRITGHDAAGVFHAVMTLRQIARQCAGTGSLPCLRIEDWPDFPNRGVMIDVARCKVPEMETLYALVDKLAELKCNQLQMYTEHTFAYRDHHTVWEDASPMTAAQIRALDAYCRDRFIELVPNQNSFGHMDRWLRLPAYAHLAETRGGSDLCPIDPGSIALLENMYDDLLPCFSSGQVNVGCDETWSLGKGRSKAACEARGVGRVYFEFLMKIRDLCRKHGKTMQFWGDIIMNHPALIPEIPEGVTAMEWGYEA
ncbi:MAG TPA: glycoside hydrolase family 20 zincin-like fold domain-containing protein, partial [Candidatus Hydrogenedentes bacterium]|nr:glycoside hydrolase family 20 zincin-like fold domain-containing protein [Candidatus Hydrogenedentota bacterium]